MTKIVESDTWQVICFENSGEVCSHETRLDDFTYLIDIDVVKVILAITATAQPLIFFLLLFHSYCSSTNPQVVTVTAGSTASVSFTNKLNTGSVKLVKATNTGENLSGWQIGLYTDTGCTNAVSGSPFITGADGTVTAAGLQKGTYYAKEIPTDDPYWAFDTAVKSVTVAVGQTAEVTFTNTHYGRIEFRKTTNTGNHLDGWTFRVKDSNGNTVGDFTTDANGYACTENLPLLNLHFLF